MLRFKVEDTQHLFRKAQILSKVLSNRLASIVQNNMTISDDELMEFNDLVDRFIVDIDDWRAEILEHIGSNEVNEIQEFRKQFTANLVETTKEPLVGTLPFDNDVPF